jgi:hypothetical protein
LAFTAPMNFFFALSVTVYLHVPPAFNRLIVVQLPPSTEKSFASSPVITVERPSSAAGALLVTSRVFVTGCPSAASPKAKVPAGLVVRYRKLGTHRGVAVPVGVGVAVEVAVGVAVEVAVAVMVAVAVAVEVAVDVAPVAVAVGVAVLVRVAVAVTVAVAVAVGVEVADEVAVAVVVGVAVAVVVGVELGVAVAVGLSDMPPKITV